MLVSKDNLLKFFAVGAAFGTLAILAVCFLLTFSIVDKPFTGFLVEANRTVSVGQGENWTGSRAGLQVGDQILTVNQIPVLSLKVLERIGNSVPVGTPLTYTVKRENRRLRFSIPTQLFSRMDFLLYAFPWLLFGLVMLFLGSLVVLLRPSDRVAWVHFVFCLALALLGATNYESITTHVFSIVNQMSLVLVGVSGVHLSVLFPKPLRSFENNCLQGLLYLPLFILFPLILLLYPHPERWVYCFYVILSLSSFGIVAIAFSALISVFSRSSSPLVRRQSQIVLFGSLLGTLPTVLAYVGTLFSAPPALASLCNFLLMLFPCAIAYAIVRHHLFAIEVIIRKTVIYTLVTASLVLFYFLLLAGFRALLGDQRSLWSNILTTAVIAILFAPLDEATRKLVDRTFFRSGYDFRQIISNFSETARLTFDASQLIAAFTREVETALHPSLMAVFLAQGKRLVLIESRGILPSQLAELDPEKLDLEALSGKKRHPEDPLSAFEMTIPLLVKEELIGLVVLGSRKSDLGYKAEDRELIKNLCQQMALWLKNAQLFFQLASQERMQKELEIAHSVQTGFLPAVIPTFRGLEIAALSRPALEVGGDFYDVIPIGPQSLGILIGDVSGKGVPAALLMAMTLSIFRTIASDQLTAAETMQRLNALIYANKPSPKMFVTALYAIYDEKDHSLYFANAGHNLPLSSLGSIDCSGSALGIMKDSDYQECRIDLKVNEMIFFSTDGLEDALNPQGVHFGDKNPLSDADLRRTSSPQVLIDSLLAEIDRFIEGEQQFDDITLLALKRTGA